MIGVEKLNKIIQKKPTNLKRIRNLVLIINLDSENLIPTPTCKGKHMKEFGVPIPIQKERDS